MDRAKCVLDNKIYTALEFSNLPPGEMSTKRKHFVCTECHAVAFFRKASRKGRAACFGAFPHAEDCSLSLSGAQGSKGKVDESLVSQSKRLLRFNLEDAHSSYVEAKLTKNEEKADAVNIVEMADALKLNPNAHRQLSAILKFLIITKKFKVSHVEVENEYGPLTAESHFFKSFDLAKFDQSEKLQGYWGMLTDARFSSEGALWLNSGGNSDVSCVIQEKLVDKLFKRYSLEDEEELAGAYVIVVGDLEVSSKGKKYIELNDLDQLDLICAHIDEGGADRFFLNEKARIAFFLTRNKLGVFDEELGIKRKHYIDKSAAKEWRAKLSSQFHPDKNLDDLSIDYVEIMSCINKIYSRMVGEA